MGRLEGRLAIVTGAAAGLGRAIAELYAREGATVALVDLDGPRAERAADTLVRAGWRAAGFAADVGDEAAVATAFARIRDDLGEADILVNNAGIVGVCPLERMETSAFDELIRVDLKSVFLCSREVLPAMRRRGYGRIVNVSSQIAYKGAEGMTHYAAAKAGVLGLTRSLAREAVGDGIAVNAICPGPLDTEMKLPPDWVAAQRADIPARREGRVEEVAPTALLLATEEAGFYVGATFHPNGGDVMV